MTDIKYWKRMAQTWEANAQFYLMEIERITILYNKLLQKYEELEKKCNE